MSQLSVNKLQSFAVGPVTFEIAPRECVCLSGPSGAGKTQLLRAIADLDPHQGQVYLDDIACLSVSGPQWRSWVAYLAAESQWWHALVGPHLLDLDENWLTQLGFGQEVLTWSVSRLSTGERQRLALLRLLSLRPKALLLDEPSASLDPVNVLKVETVVADYRQQHDAAVLWVSHDPRQIARIAQRHLVIDQGRLTVAALDQ